MNMFSENVRCQLSLQRAILREKEESFLLLYIITTVEAVHLLYNFLYYFSSRLSF